MKEGNENKNKIEENWKNKKERNSLNGPKHILEMGLCGYVWWLEACFSWMKWT